MDRLIIKYRVAGKAIGPQSLRMKIPGWGGAADKKMQDGSEPQPWHCPPFVEASATGLELSYPYETECHVVNVNGQVRFEWDYAKEPGAKLNGSDFGLFDTKPPKYYLFNTSIDLQAPPGHVLRTQPHPRFFTDDTGTVPLSMIGDVQTEWWARKLFVVFRAPRPGQRHIFRKGEPYVQIVFVPQQPIYELVRMTPAEEARRSSFETAIATDATYIATSVWHEPSGGEFKNHYKVLERAFARDGIGGIEEVLRNAADRKAASLPLNKTVPEYLALAEKYKKERRLIDAREVYFHVCRLDPENQEAVKQLSMLAQTMGLAQVALDMMTKAVARSPEYRDNVGEALRRLGRYKDAEASFRASLQLNPNDAEVMSNLGLTLAQQGRATEGLQLCRAALTIAPNMPIVHYRMGLIFAQLQQAAEARSSYNAALTLDPDFAPARRGLEELPAEAAPSDWKP